VNERAAAQDRSRADELRLVVVGILTGNVAIIAWLASGSRTLGNTFGIWLLACALAMLAWIVAVERRPARLATA
jgi:hypothetical protein